MTFDRLLSKQEETPDDNTFLALHIYWGKENYSS